MKKFTIQVILLIIVIAGSLFLFNAGNQTGGKIDIPFLPQPAKTGTLQIGNVSLTVEVADTNSKRSKGLGGRESLPQDQGMLFIFDRTDKFPFWMKGLSFPLDFVWIKDDTVADILENILQPEAGQSDSALPIYSSKVEVNKVLEVNAGTVQRLNIKVGDKIQLK